MILALIWANCDHVDTTISAKIVSEKTLFELSSEGDTVTVDGRYYLDQLITSLENMSFSVSALKIDNELTSIEELKNIQGKVRLELMPFEGAYYELKVFDKKDLWVTLVLKKYEKENSFFGIKWASPKIEKGKLGTVYIWPQPMVLRQHLGSEMVLARIAEISLRAQKFQLTFHDVKVKCGGFEKKFETAQTIGGVIEELASPLSFKTEKPAAEGMVCFIMPIRSGGELGLIDIKPQEINDVRFYDFKKGYFRMYKRNYLDLASEKERRSIKVKGGIKGKDNFDEIVINRQGIETSFRTKTQEILINGCQSQITYFDFFLSHKFITSMVVFLLWFADKMITYYVSKTKS